MATREGSGSSMVNDITKDDFIKRFRDIQVNQDNSNLLIQDILEYYKRFEDKFQRENESLRRELDELHLDYIAATKSRRDLQQQEQFFRTELHRLTSENERIKFGNPYITILIDGDGLIFQDRFVRGGIEGGREAAYALRAAVAEQCGDQASNIEIIAKIVTDMNGLSKAMARDGAIENPSYLREFALGFTQAKASFDFIDVGRGKGRIDQKIKETAKWHLSNFNCQQVLLGISHDAGYASFLNEILRDEIIRQRVTVIEGATTHKDLVLTGVNTFPMGNDIFRTDKLIDRSEPSSIINSPDITNTSTNSNGGSIKPIPSAAAVAAASQPSSSPAATPPPSVPAGPTPVQFSSFAAVAQKSTPKPKPATPPPQISIPLAPRPASSAKRAKDQALAQLYQQQQLLDWNPGPRGLDKPIAVVPTVLDAVKKRKDNNKLCNNHFLRGPCSKGDSCTFVHNYKPTVDEIDAIAFLTRLNPCTLGQDCESDECIYGHHCPSVKDNYCTHPYCKFPVDAHPPGTKFKKTHNKESQ